MARKKRSIPEINAGSMADIAFLLLIFFLVTTTIQTDFGIKAKLPELSDVTDPIKVKERNVLSILVNANNQLLVEGKPMAIEELKEKTKKFVLNNGNDPNLSEEPQKAVVYLKNDRGTKYEVYIQVWNELAGAYNEIRTAEAERRYGKSYEQLKKDKEEDKIHLIDSIYPKYVSEAEPESYGKED